MTKQQALAEIDASNVRVGQRWRHFKGGEYDVVAVALLEASLDPAVVYAGHDGVVWIRALHVFLEEASPGVPRFSRLDEEERSTIPSRERVCWQQEDNCKAADCPTHGPLFPPSKPDAGRERGRGGVL